MSWIGFPSHARSSIIKHFKNKKSNQNSKKKDCIIYEGIKLSTRFPVKDRTKFEYIHKVVYFSHCPNVTCNERYVGETN